jgi:hypothetical protein
MKKIAFASVLILLAFSFTSCEKEKTETKITMNCTNPFWTNS